MESFERFLTDDWFIGLVLYIHLRNHFIYNGLSFDCNLMLIVIIWHFSSFYDRMSHSMFGLYNMISQKLVFSTKSQTTNQKNDPWAFLCLWNLIFFPSHLPNIFCATSDQKKKTFKWEHMKEKWRTNIKQTNYFEIALLLKN